MKKTLTCTIAISFALLACDTDTNSATVDCNAAAKQSSAIAFPYEELGPSCKSEQRKLVVIFDLQSVEVNWDYIYSHLPGYVPGSGMVSEYGSGGNSSVYYNVNGIDMTQEEYEAYKREYQRKYEEELEKNKRILQIPCSLSDGRALLTDEEITELKENYSELAIEDYIEPTPSIVGPIQGCDG